MDLHLQSKRALVTGSTSGIGAAIARALAREGVLVVVHGRRAEAAAAVVEGIAKEGGTAVVALGDLANDDSADRVCDEALAAFGGIDIVVNNVGASVRESWASPDPARWAEQYNLNVLSAVRTVRRLAPPMRERRWGRFIQIASTAAINPAASVGPYAASKAALINLSVSLAKGLADTGITANTVSPGVVMTADVETWIRDTAAREKWDGSFEDHERRLVAAHMQNPTGRVGRVEDVADLVAFLASPRAGYVDGANLRVDGGWLPTTN